MSRVLIVEDDPAIATSLERALISLGHEARVEGSAEAALAALEGLTAEFDVAVIDVMLPGMDGFELCRRVTLSRELPVILLTARSDPVDVVVGLECGADDYVVKPAVPRVLDARIKTVLRRSASPIRPVPGAPIGHDVVLDQAAMTVTRAGRPLHLTPTEMRLLVQLADHRGQVLTRRTLLERVWDYGYDGDTRLVDAAVQRLRAKIEPDPANPTLIRTVRGFGYRLDAP